ncbi:hypothetical protein UFOVP861_32 [uncultured Caudovirales phage]|uniref:Uncharacterized protein n=1 Tax=uncultured Caudovirales phage TaxID=2100421 RepID=A0A6J5PE80_9CAUD|nr:hypothetical protein UFOVP861_32 [uncultured Caudovirales phage]
MSKQFTNAFPEGSPGGGGAGTDLTKTLTANTVKINSSTGADVTIAAANSSNAGVMTSTHHDKLDGIEATADVTDAGNVGSSIHGATPKTTPVNADTMPLIDSAASNVLKKVTWEKIKETLKAYFDTLYSTFTNPMSASGDIIYGGTAGAGTRLAKGSNGQVLTLASGLPSWATPSAGGTISTPQVYYVETTANGGNDATGVVGNPSLPYATGTAAEAAGHTAAVPFVIRLGVSPVGGPHTIYLTDRPLSSYLTSIIGLGDQASGLQIINSPPASTPGNNGLSGYDNILYLYDLGAAITCNGGVPTPIDTETLNGGGAGTLTVNGRCLINSIQADGGPPLNTGTGGNGATVILNGNVKLLNISIVGGSNPDCATGTDGNLCADGADLRQLPSCTASYTAFGRCSYDNAVFATITNDYGGNAVY